MRRLFAQNENYQIRILPSGIWEARIHMGNGQYIFYELNFSKSTLQHCKIINYNNSHSLSYRIQIHTGDFHILSLCFMSTTIKGFGPPSIILFIVTIPTNYNVNTIWFVSPAAAAALIHLWKLYVLLLAPTDTNTHPFNLSPVHNCSSKDTSWK